LVRGWKFSGSRGGEGACEVLKSEVCGEKRETRMGLGFVGGQPTRKEREAQQVRTKVK